MTTTARTSSANGRIVRVASGQGFWGDWLEAPRRQVEGGDVDYLMLDYLAEVTMSILQKQKERDPKMGYARDFVGAIESVLPAIAERGVRVIANAGGVNPPACAAAIRDVARKHGVSDKVRIGVVTGDDLLPRIDELIAAGIIAGHIIECGAQCSGGNCLYDWETIPDLANVGYPIVEGHADGSFVIYKNPNTGGRISVPSVTEQLVYEMGDPRSYITPDVVADFTSIHLEQAGEDRVRVFGITGRPPTDKLKVSIAYRAGFKAVGTLVYAWPDALAKAKLADKVLRERIAGLGLSLDHIMTEFVGVSATHGKLAGPVTDPPEVQLRIGVRGTDKASVERFTREIAPLVLNGPPTVTGFAGGRPKVEEIVAYWPALIDKTVVTTHVEVLA